MICETKYTEILLAAVYTVSLVMYTLSSFLTCRPVVYANMSTKPIKVSRAQSGFLFFKSDKVVCLQVNIIDLLQINELCFSKYCKYYSLKEEISMYILCAAKT